MFAVGHLSIFVYRTLFPRNIKLQGKNWFNVERGRFLGRGLKVRWRNRHPSLPREADRDATSDQVHLIHRGAGHGW